MRHRMVGIETSCLSVVLDSAVDISETYQCIAQVEMRPHVIGLAVQRLEEVLLCPLKISLMGTPSGGAPDGTEAFVLGHTSLRIEVSSLVTYLADGRRLGAASIDPDILSFPVPESFLRAAEDVQLESARKYLVARKRLR